jgi:hypothetical protein
MNESIRLKLDTTQLTGALSLLKHLLHVRHEVINLPVGIFEAFQEFFSLKDHGAVGGLTGELWISLEPTERFRAVVAALRAGNGHFGVLVKDGHVNPQDQLMG